MFTAIFNLFRFWLVSYGHLVKIPQHDICMHWVFVSKWTVNIVNSQWN